MRYASPVCELFQESPATKASRGCVTCYYLKKLCTGQQTHRLFFLFRGRVQSQARQERKLRATRETASHKTRVAEAVICRHSRNMKWIMQREEKNAGGKCSTKREEDIQRRRKIDSALYGEKTAVKPE